MENKYRCDVCKDSGAVKTGEFEYSEFPCVSDDRNFTSSAKNAQVELIGNSEQLNLLIDFCGLIEDNKIRKQMFKKIQPFLRGDNLSLLKRDKKQPFDNSKTAIDWLISKIALAYNVCI